MCPLADCCVYSSVLPESIQMDLSSWAWLWPGDEYTTARLQAPPDANPPSCVFGVLQELGTCCGLWVLRGLSHTGWCGLRTPALPRAPVSGSLRSAGRHLQRLRASGLQPLERWAQACPADPLPHCRSGTAWALPTAASALSGGWLAVFQACLYWWSLDEANFVGFMKIKVRVCLWNPLILYVSSKL